MGYVNTKVRLDFPDLSEDDDPIFVTIRNPRVVPSMQLLADDLPDETDSAARLDASFKIMAGLIVDWHVYDGTTDDGDPLPLPATVETLRLLPMEITGRIADEVAQVTRPPR